MQVLNKLPILRSFVQKLLRRATNAQRDIVSCGEVPFRPRASNEAMNSASMRFCGLGTIAQIAEMLYGTTDMPELQGVYAIINEALCPRLTAVGVQRKPIAG